MQKLIDLIAEKANISQDQAKVAAETAFGFVKQYLPAPIAAELERLVCEPQHAEHAEVSHAEAYEESNDMLGKIFDT